MTITPGDEGSPVVYRGLVGLVSGWVGRDGHVWVDLPTHQGTHASLSVHAGKELNLAVVADHLHDDITELVNALRDAWREWRRTELPREIARLKAQLGAGDVA